MTFLLLYSLLAFIFMAFVFWNTYGEDDSGYNDEISEEKRKSVLIAMSAFWPLTLVFIAIMFLWDKFTTRVRRRVRQLYSDYQAPDDLKIDEQDEEVAEYTIKNKAIKRMTTRELEYILFASKIQAIELHEASKNLVQRILADRAFEKEVLNK